jgi:hypothetical protein
MKRLAIYLSLITLFLGSCSKYLDQYPYGNYSGEDNWKSQQFVQGLVGQCYEYMTRDYNNNEGYYLDGATDDAVVTTTTNVMNKLAVGSMVTGDDPFATYWTNDYRAISLVNLFLKDRRGINTRFLLDAPNNTLVSRRLQGEAYALRAWFQWDLLKRWGGKGTNGTLLGYPIVLEPLLDYAKDLSQQLNLPRNTYAECVAQIEADCDSAYAYLPIAHRDFLVPAGGDKTYQGGLYWGRMDGITTRAILADMYLTYASPLFNPANDKTRWVKAAQYAKAVIDFKLTKDNVANGFVPANRVIWTNPNFPGIVFSSRVSGSTQTSIATTSDAMERALYPKGFQGNGVIGATQDIVDAFPMKNGYPISDPRSLYDPLNPYLNRDNRFYSVIYHNLAPVKLDNTGTLWYTFENWENASGTVGIGKDAAGPQATSRTNYHIKKFISMKVNWSMTTVTREPHSKFYYRWAHMILAFAEAANEVEGANGTTFGLSAKNAIKYLRTRKTYDNLSTFTVDPYLDEVAGNPDNFRAFIKNERRLETCFEGLRFFDLRRWNTAVTALNNPVHKAKITRNESGIFTYESAVVDNRKFNSLYLPIPYAEMLKMSKLIQNEGWEAWGN